MKSHHFLLTIALLLPLLCHSQERKILAFPRLEQLSSKQVLQVIQDSEGYLWYATEGGGVCRDDGREILVFRSDAAHPDLLKSNDISCLAEVSKRHILIGGFHGAYLLDKEDYSIRRLPEVDDYRVDDIIVSADGHCWLTANKKVYEYTSVGQLLKTYSAGERYLARLHEDRHGHLWASEWGGGLLCLNGSRFVASPWPLDVPPTSINDDTTSDALLVGTIGKGEVRYYPANGTIERTSPKDSVCMSRVTRDLQGRNLVADGRGHCYAVCDSEPCPWYEGGILTKTIADSLRNTHQLSCRPTAYTFSQNGTLWFSTGKDIRQKKDNKEIVVVDNIKDVSAMTFTPDGTLWLATIFGTLSTYKDGHLSTDTYASNEYGDEVIQLASDSLGRLLLVSDRYVRLYDPVRHTLRQQCREASGIYSIELAETAPGQRWSQPPEPSMAERLPRWAFWTLALLFVILSLLLAYIWHLNVQRQRFIASMKKEPTSEEQPSDAPSADETSAYPKEWLQEAISKVEAHLGDDSYGVEQLASDLCMSRMTFYRKIQSATGQKPTEFIRTIRLRHAAQLLREGQHSITEISYAAGFSSVSYFSRCFRTMYGVPPTQFGKATTADDLLPSDTPN